MRRFRLNLGSWNPSSVLDLSLKQTVGLILGVICALLVLLRVNSIRSLEITFSHAIEFSLRHALKLDPVLDDRIIIYAFGDSSLSELKEEGLELGEWADALKALADAHPRAVIIDKVFAAPRGVAERASFVSKLKSLPFPVTVGAFVSHSPISSRTLQPLVDLSTLFSKPDEASHQTNALDYLRITSGFPYGPASEIREGFAHVGHVMYFGNLISQPIIRMSRQDVLPATALFAAKQIQFRDGALYTDDKKVPLDRQGEVVMNLSHPGVYFDRTYRMSTLVEKAHLGKSVALPKDAVVLILPSLFTGATDIQPTPFGMLPGGYLVASLINSVLTGNWITTPKGESLGVILGAITGYLLLWLVPARFFLISVGTLSLSIAVSGLVSFIWFSAELPWLSSMLSLIFSSLLLFAENLRWAKRNIISQGEAEQDFTAVVEALGRENKNEDSREGIRFGRYHFLELVGSGGMGEVYRAKTHGAGGFEKEFAIKRIVTGQLLSDQALALFEEEARLNSVLTQGNIAQVFEFFRMKNTYLMVMEFIHGKNLAQVIQAAYPKEYRLPLPLSVQIMDEVCKGLEYAHGKRDPRTGMALNIIHRDISPQNVMLSYEGAVKIIDFGIAKGKFHAELTAAGVIKGKFAFMSPEQASGGVTDQRSDLFSAGLILFELVTGARILEGQTDVETIQNVRDARIPKASILNPFVPKELDKILLRCLAKDPDDRYPDATALRFDLEEFLQSYQRSSLPQSLSQLLKLLFAKNEGGKKEGNHSEVAKQITRKFG